MKQTAVEYLIQELTEIGALNINGLHWSDKDDANSAIEKAKDMEMLQITEAFDDGFENHFDGGLYYSKKFKPDYKNETL